MAVFFLLAAIVGAAHAQCVMNTTYPGRLPSSVIPSQYTLNLTLGSPNHQNLNNRDNFSGFVSIAFQVFNQTTCIVMNAGPNITITSAQVIISGQSTTPQLSTQPEYQFLLLTMPQPMMVGTMGMIKLAFTATVNTVNATGLFVCDNTYNPNSTSSQDYADLLRRAPWAEGRTRPRKVRITAGTEMMYATQFEQSDARNAFPCFDEPPYKAYFRSTVSVPDNQGLMVLNNAPIMTSSSNNGMLTVNFEQFPQVMSTYLVAFAVGRFDYVETYNSDGVRFRVYTPPGWSSYGQYALNISVQFVDFYYEKLNLPFSAMTSKLDQISVPGIDDDAMENWGLCTYSPVMLLVAPTATERNQLQLVAQVTAHEIFHQWFGDTITCPWWNDEYLQEGFARLYEYIAVDHLYPEWYVWTTPDATPLGNTEFYTFVYNNAMSIDYTGTAPPVIVPTANWTEANPTIFYAKGASINYMIRNWMTDNQWTKALSYHILNHLWSNPNEYDLMDSFAAVGWPIGPLWLPWLQQSGFPVVTLDINSNNLVTATQRPIASTLPPSQLWWVLLNVQATNQSNPAQTQEFLMNFSTQSSTFQLPQGNGWNLYGNYNYTSYFVCNYDQQSQWNAVLSQLANPNFPAVDAQLLEEAVFYLGNAP